jgi:hypothetical protein
MVIKNKFELGQVVYLVTDEEQASYMVIGIEAQYGGGVLYHLQHGSSDEAYVRENEMSATKEPAL